MVEQGWRGDRPHRRARTCQARSEARPPALLSASERAVRLAVRGHLDRASAILRSSPEPAALAWLRWIDAYAALCRGDFAAADQAAAELATDATAAEVRVAALITLGSSARQAGRHQEGRIHDTVARTIAVTASQRTHALIGLAADAVGLGEEQACSSLLAEAAAIAPASDHRVRTRLAWVSCEHALLTGSPQQAVAHARRAVRSARLMRSARHRAKSLLFLGVSLEAVGDRRAPRVLRRVVGMTRGRRGFEPILEVAERMMQRVDG